MKIGIIIYSQTGNTRLAANRLEEGLAKAGHEVMLLEVMAAGTPGDISLTERPDPKPFDLVIFGGPVQAFDACQVMKRYLHKLPDGFDKPYILFTTQQLPYKWMGGNRAIRTMKQMVETKGGRYVGHANVNWSRPDREKRIEGMIEHMLDMIEIDAL